MQNVLACRKPSGLSLNAAIFASVLLASRLATVSEVFALIALAILAFRFIPTFRIYLRQRSARLHVGFTVLIHLTTVALCYMIGATLALTVSALLIFLGFVCPWWFFSLHRYKE